MVLVRTYRKILKITDSNPVLADKIVDKMAELEDCNIVRGSKDWTEEELVCFCKFVGINIKEEDNMVENKIVTDENEYISKFDGIILKALQDIGHMQGIDVKKLYQEDVLTNGMLGELRYKIIESLATMTNSHIDLSPPEKEYKLGDEVSLYYQQLPTKAKIVRIGNIDSDSYALLIDDKYEIAFEMVAESPTNYMIELQKIINVE